jgi:hypothetical protein
MLPESSPRRGMVPVTEGSSRTDKFIASYERDVLFYDVFWHVAGREVILVGPPPVDLDPLYRAMSAIAQPSGRPLRLRPHHSRKVYLFSARVPPGTTHLDLEFAGTVQRVAVGPNHSDFFAGENLLFTLSQNNDLQWIADWARFHVANQGVTAVLLFDNRSSRYGLEDLRATLSSVPGLARFAVVDVPFRYTGPDDALASDRFWAHFLQPSTFVGMLRRYGARANGILNCDVDELAVPLGPETVFEAANRSHSGTLYFRSSWVEPVPRQARTTGYRHADFGYMKPKADFRTGHTHKWALSPKRRWLQWLKVHPYTHLLKNRLPFTRIKSGAAYIAHFRGISTSWKYDRSVVVGSVEQLKTEPNLERALQRAFPGTASTPDKG